MEEPLEPPVSATVPMDVCEDDDAEAQAPAPPPRPVPLPPQPLQPPANPSSFKRHSRANGAKLTYILAKSRLHVTNYGSDLVSRHFYLGRYRTSEAAGAACLEFEAGCSRGES